ncbi:hypothetical protein HUS23_09235 [Ectothiorhodospiraceae bacterium 2226]|nr:hypothetical protein HUS23_09235 [Ectothiorhodospiraceae bacterium 2226]
MSRSVPQQASAPEHCRLHTPHGPKAPVWRYMNFAKLMFLFESRAMFFPYSEAFTDVMDGRPAGLGDHLPRRAVSSWHMSPHESEAMWRLYSPPEEAVALHSTWGRLREVLPACVRIHTVRYADQADPACLAHEPLYHYFIKRRAFEHEKELRAVVEEPCPAERAGEARHSEAGWLVPVDLEHLITQVYVSPTAADWYYELVQRLSARYGLQCPVERSALTGTLRA